MKQIDVGLVTRLIQEQFPNWAHLDIKPVKVSGHDNRTFHLGDQMSMRLPSAKHYVPQVEKEQFWLPTLAKQLSLPISAPIAKGDPNHEYPFPWSINKWIEGKTLTHENIDDLNQFAIDLAAFLIELQAIDATDGPLAGKHNFYRGGDIAVYHEETEKAIEKSSEVFNVDILQAIWALALASQWEATPVWVHGDIAPGNILVNHGKLCAIIDFGTMGVGDPACDAAIAWTFFDEQSRKLFKEALRMDDKTWNRARGWALWKALITYHDHHHANHNAVAEAYKTIHVIAKEFQ